MSTQKPGKNLLWLRAFVAATPWPDECVLWPGSKNAAGYGRVWYNNHYFLTHRLAFEFANGPVPPGMFALHRCVNSRACCNPAHLYAGTPKENNADMAKAGTRVRGESHYAAKLNAEKVFEIRRRRAAGEPGWKLALEFDVPQSTISKIIHRTVWSHVEVESDALPREYGTAVRNAPGAWLRALAETRPWPAECAEYPGAKNEDGYGMTRHKGRNRRAHRVIYELLYGMIPAGMSVLHRCKQTRACCNPAHLYLGTAADNARDKVLDDTIPRGDAHYSRTHPEKLAGRVRNRWGS
jgi:hypothetical protein